MYARASRRSTILLVGRGRRGPEQGVAPLHRLQVFAPDTGRAGAGGLSARGHARPEQQHIPGTTRVLTSAGAAAAHGELAEAR